MKKKIIFLLFCILSNIAILYIIVLNSIQLYSTHSKKSLLDLIYSIFALIIFIRFELILLKKEYHEPIIFSDLFIDFWENSVYA
jgi:hypothetical protein